VDHVKGFTRVGFFPLSESILYWNLPIVTNTLAYCVMVTVTSVKCFIIQALGFKAIKPFSFFAYATAK